MKNPFGVFAKKKMQKSEEKLLQYVDTLCSFVAGWTFKVQVQQLCNHISHPSSSTICIQQIFVFSIPFYGIISFA